MSKESVLFYLFLVIFSLTALITLLGITNVIKNMNPAPSTPSCPPI